MKTVRLTVIAATLVSLLLAPTFLASAETIEELEKKAQTDPADIKAKEALAEAYLKECYLEKSLALWQRILKHVPDHKRAKEVVSRLTLQALDLDSHLAILDTLIEKGVTAETESLLDAAAHRAATDAQKARILYLRGKLALRGGKEAQARLNFQSALSLYPDSRWSAQSTIALADAECKARRADEARRLLAGIIENERLKDDAVKQEARFKMVLLASEGLPPKEKIAAVQELLKTISDPAVKRQVLGQLIDLLNAEQGRWVPEAIDATAEILKTHPPYDETTRILADLLEVAGSNQDAAVLDRLLVLVNDVQLQHATLKREVSFIGAEALLSRAVVEQEAAEMKRLVKEAHTRLDALDVASAVYPDRNRIDDLRGRAYLVEAQKLIALADATQALPVLLKAKEHYLRLLPGNPRECLARLENVGRLLEHIEEWETAVAVYREVATRFPHIKEGRDSLLKVASLYEKNLNAPMAAIEVYAEYCARYPADLPYRQLALGERLKRLGYANLLDFQKRNHLNPDGIYGPKTQGAIEEAEKSFDMISVREDRAAEVLRGKFVHPRIFKIAQGLEKAGRHHEAILAYRMFLNLFPTKREADDALIAVARLFRDNLLFTESLGAYEQLMADYPDGDLTSEAYIEAAQCCENLSRWAKAREYYELYAKKFPKYKHTPLCKARLALLDEVQQYEDLFASSPDNPKLAEARYQIATILYKGFKNYTKAAVEFHKVADEFPKHTRAPDGLFTAGTAHLHAENFPAARNAFGELAQGYPDSRLADDGQYWIGHTYEYSARAVGKLDKKRIILKRRGLQGRALLAADMALRRQYNPEARPEPEVPEDIWGGDTLGVLASGSIRDRVNADLFRAIRAYREVVDKFKTGDMAGPALLRIGTIYTQYLKDPERGIEAFQELLAHYPACKGAADALFEVGEYHIKKKNYDEAIKVYEQFIYNYPTSEKVEDAMLSTARCCVEKKDWHKALDAYQSYLSKFPQGKQADFAKAQVEWIRMYHF